MSNGIIGHIWKLFPRSIQQHYKKIEQAKEQLGFPPSRPVPVRPKTKKKR